MNPDEAVNQSSPDQSEAGSRETENWQTSVQRLYDRKNQERQPIKEGDPQRYRQVAAEIAAGQQYSDVLTSDGLIDDSTPLTSGDYCAIAMPSPRGSYPYWRQITGTTFLEHEIIQGDAQSQRLDVVFAQVAWEILQQFGLEAAYVFLLMTTRLLNANDPWEEIIELSTDDLLRLNIWERDLDISLGKRLRLAGNWFELVCNLSLLISKVDSESAHFTALRIPFWVLEEMEYGGTVTSAIGGVQPEEAQELTIRVGLGRWTEQFTAITDQAKQDSLKQFSHQASVVLAIDPTRKPLAAKLAILGLLLARLAPTEAATSYAVGAILEQLESKASLIEIHRRKDRRNATFSRWNSSLHSLQKLGWTIGFDDALYPIELQPSWHQPDDRQLNLNSDAWVDRWLQAQIRLIPPVLEILEPPEIELPLTERFTGKNLAQALEIKGLSRSKLAEHLQLDRSMVTYWIKGARLIQPKHREQICELLGEELQQVMA